MKNTIEVDVCRDCKHRKCGDNGHGDNGTQPCKYEGMGSVIDYTVRCPCQEYVE